MPVDGLASLVSGMKLRSEAVDADLNVAVPFARPVTAAKGAEIAWLAWRWPCRPRLIRPANELVRRDESTQRLADDKKPIGVGLHKLGPA